MGYSLEEFASDVRGVLTDHPIEECSDQVVGFVKRALKDDDFVETYLQDRAPGAEPREVLLEDKELGFCICGHVYSGEATGAAHDHGPSWAVYGQARGTTEMTDWEIVEKGDGDTASRVKPSRTYVLSPGDAHYYAVGAVHSPKRVAPTRLIRVEGSNLDHVTRSNIAVAG